MNELFNSKFIKDLEVGIVPEIPIKIATETVIETGVMLVIVFLIVILMYNILKK
jgi:hypothetical protein